MGYGIWQSNNGEMKDSTTVEKQYDDLHTPGRRQYLIRIGTQDHAGVSALSAPLRGWRAGDLRWKCNMQQRPGKGSGRLVSQTDDAHVSAT